MQAIARSSPKSRSMAPEMVEIGTRGDGRSRGRNPPPGFSGVSYAQFRRVFATRRVPPRRHRHGRRASYPITRSANGRFHVLDAECSDARGAREDPHTYRAPPTPFVTTGSHGLGYLLRRAGADRDTCSGTISPCTWSSAGRRGGGRSFVSMRSPTSSRDIADTLRRDPLLRHRELERITGRPGDFLVIMRAALRLPRRLAAREGERRCMVEWGFFRR